MNLKQEKQEMEYDIPYHYLPKFIDGNVIPGLELDWASEYLLSLRLVEEYVEYLKPNSLLDIGCGDGRLANEMSIKFPKMAFTGIDYSKRAIRFVQAMQNTTNVEFLAVDLKHEEKEMLEKYDMVTSIEVLEYIPIDSVREFFHLNISRVKKNGYFLIIVPHENKKLIDKHEQHFSSEKILELIDKCPRKLEAVEFRYLDNNSWIFELFRRAIKNRFYTLNPLWRAFLKKKITYSRGEEGVSGRIFCLIRCN